MDTKGYILISDTQTCFTFVSKDAFASDFRGLSRQGLLKFIAKGRQQPTNHHGKQCVSTKRRLVYL